MRTVGKATGRLMTAMVLALTAADGRIMAAPAPASTARPLVTIIGELNYRERMALPAGATLLVTLAEPGMADDPAAPTLARQNIDLAGQQVPLRFRLTAAAGKLKAGTRYAVRALIQDAGGRPLWSIRSGHVIDPDRGLHDLGTLWLARAALPAAPAPAGDAALRPPGTAFQCGEREVVALFHDGGLDLTLDGVTHRLDRALSASGARYAGTAGGKAVEFWNKGRNALLSVQGEPEAACAQADLAPVETTGLYDARGHGPAWTLRIGNDRLDLMRFGTGTSEIARIPLPERQLLADGHRYVARLGEGQLRVTINPGLCLDDKTGVPFPDRVTVETDGQVLDGCGGSAASFLTPGEWRVTALNGQPVTAEAGLTMRFGPQGEVAGHAGCNRFIARYRADESGLTIASRTAAATLMACPREMMQREQTLLSTLRAIQRHTAEPDGTLVLTGLDDAEIRLRRLP